VLVLYEKLARSPYPGPLVALSVDSSSVGVAGSVSGGPHFGPDFAGPDMQPATEAAASESAVRTRRRRIGVSNPDGA
jgi:hypothetical protein